MKKRPQVLRTRFLMPKLIVKSSQCASRAERRPLLSK
jgi:hypothetical protein